MKGADTVFRRIAVLGRSVEDFTRADRLAGLADHFNHRLAGLFLHLESIDGKLRLDFVFDHGPLNGGKLLN